MTENIDVSPLYNAIYGDGHFEQVRLGSLINKGGAAGKIYLDASHPNSVAKIFTIAAKAQPTAKSWKPCCLTARIFPKRSKTGSNACKLPGRTLFWKMKTVLRRLSDADD